MVYFKNPDNKKNWDNELRQLKVEKARRAGGYAGEIKREEAPYRRSITFEQLAAMERDSQEPERSGRTIENQMEKSMQPEGMSL